MLLFGKLKKLKARLKIKNPKKIFFQFSNYFFLFKKKKKEKNQVNKENLNSLKDLFCPCNCPLGNRKKLSAL